MSDQDFVEMVHPDIADRAEATEEAFRTVWEPRGWTRVGSEDQAEDNSSVEAKTGELPENDPKGAQDDPDYKSG